MFLVLCLCVVNWLLLSWQTLELVKMHIIEVVQVGEFSEVWLKLIASPLALPAGDALGYG